MSAKYDVAVVGATGAVGETMLEILGERDFPDIKRDYAHVDATTMWMVKNPEWFDVIVTGNMFGDIITDLGAMVQGGMGVAAGGNINPDGVSMFEPIGGSAPKYTGQNKVNPMAMMLSGVMMLHYLGEQNAADRMENAIAGVIAEGKSLTYDMKPDNPVGTSQVADAIIEKLG